MQPRNRAQIPATCGAANPSKQGLAAALYCRGVTCARIPGEKSHLSRYLLLAALIALSAAISAFPAFAQADYRNLDAGRPIAVEDAQSIEYRAMEFQFTVPRFTRERRGNWHYGFETEFKWGILKDTQFGVTTETVVARDAGETTTSSRDVQLHVLYNFNQETRHLPAIAIRPELVIGTGALGARHEHGGLKLLVSKTIRRNRLHFNGSYTVGATEALGRGGDLVNRFFYGAAYERTLPLKFMVLLVDVYARKPIDHGPTEVVLEFGTRVQLNPVWVLDTGISTGQLRPSVGPDVGFSFGLSRSFSFRSLFPRKERP